MIIFTITNNVTGQIYVGHTRNKLTEQWQKMLSAAHLNLGHPLYNEIIIYGNKNFTVEEYDIAETLQEAKVIEKEAISHFHAKSLQGYKISNSVITNKQHKKLIAQEQSILKKLFDINPLEDSTIDDALILETAENNTEQKPALNAVENKQAANLPRDKVADIKVPELSSGLQSMQERPECAEIIPEQTTHTKREASNSKANNIKNENISSSLINSETNKEKSTSNCPKAETSVLNHAEISNDAYNHTREESQPCVLTQSITDAIARQRKKLITRAASEAELELNILQKQLSELFQKAECVEN